MWRTSGPRLSQEEVRIGLKHPDNWWTVLVIDPVALRVVPFVAQVGILTPNVITMVSILLALASGVSFLLSWPVAGALLFEAARFADSMDGKVARIRKLSSRSGGFFDVAGDFVRMGWVYSCLGIWLVGHRVLSPRLALLPALIVLFWLWATTQLDLQKSIAHEPRTTIDDNSWLGRHRLARLPGSVDAAGIAVTLAPLTANPRFVVTVLWIVLIGFYALAGARNVVKGFRILTRLDAREQAAVPTSVSTSDLE